VAQFFRQEDRRRMKFDARKWSWDAPKFDSALDQRRLNFVYIRSIVAPPLAGQFWR
jgi:hypothetical protein